MKEKTTIAKKNENSRVKSLKSALKNFNFWYKVLLETEHMDDVENRKKFQRSLTTVSEMLHLEKRPIKD